MARIDHSFAMIALPADAQELFARDIAPELHRHGGLVAAKDENGHVVFSDATVDPMAFSRDGLRYALARRAFAHRIRVDFFPDGDATKIVIRGSVTRELRDALEQLGRPDRWPATRVGTSGDSIAT
jgi:hypothetical protein